MPVKIIRVLFLGACIIMGVIWGGYANDVLNANAMAEASRIPWLFMGGTGGLAVGLLVLFLLRFVSQELFEQIAPALVAIVLGLVMGYFVGQYIMFLLPQDEPLLRIFVVVTFVLIFGFAGISMGLTRASNWDTLITAVERNRANGVGPKLIDTSVIIDGRIADICESGFMEGTLLVPRFVLQELQHIADSPEVLRRAKGRRGLDILRDLQGESSKVDVRIIDDNPKEVREVDGKLVLLAKRFNAKVLTNDFNLNKVAQIEGITVLNINDLANALKPAVLPDEKMEIKIIKEGKEPNQGVGYLDDGTMVVVDSGRIHMGSKVQVVVTSVLQTAAGRMIFSRFNAILR